MNKINEYKKKINWNVWKDITSLKRPIKKEEEKKDNYEH